MKQATHTPSTNEKTLGEIAAQIRKSTPLGVIEQIARQMEIAEEAKRRIDEEGIVVRDMKGSVIAHPAIKIEQDAVKIITSLLSKHERL